MFYAIAPWITTKLWRVALVFFASSTGMLEGWWISATTFAHLPNEIVYIQTPKFIWMFMLGAALAHLYQSNKQKDNTNMAAYCMLVLAMYITLAIRGTALFPLQSFPWWAFVGLTVIIPALFEKTAKNKYDKFLGELSYPIYVCHFLLIQTIGSMMPPNGAVFALASCVTAVALVLLVDRPANKLKISRAKAIATDPGSGSPMTARQAM
jgi:peptidoglycan/LPS O-acetylase OafA/YrhL